MKRPSFQFYPADWQANSNLRRCTHEEKGIWIDVMCLLHDQEEYGIARWPLKELAQAVGTTASKLKALVSKGILKGVDAGGQCDAFVFTPTGSGRKKGDPVTLIAEQDGPLWYSSRMVLDEYKRVIRGEYGSALKASPDNAPKAAIGATPKTAPYNAPSRAHASSSSSSSDKNHSSVVAGSADSTGVAHEAAAQPAPTRKGHVCGLLRKAGMADAAPHYLTDENWEQILAKRTDEEIVEVAKAKMAARPGQRTGLKYIAPALLADPEPISANQRASPSSGYMSTNERQKLAAARAIFGTEIEGNQQHDHGRIIDVTPTATRALRG